MRQIPCAHEYTISNLKSYSNSNSTKRLYDHKWSYLKIECLQEEEEETKTSHLHHFAV